MKRVATTFVALIGVTVGLVAATVSPALAAPPANKPVVPVSCPGVGDFEARLVNYNASLVRGATLVTGQSAAFGPGITFDLYDTYDTGRGNAPVVAGRGIANRIVECTVDLTSVVGFPYTVPVGIKLTGQAAKNL